MKTINVRRSGPFRLRVKLRRTTVALAEVVGPGLLAAAALIAWGMKRHYADARADDLLWMLTPTAQLVGVVTGATFTLQPGEGYFSRDNLFLIEKSCAGINFMIAAFAMLVFAFRHRVGSLVTAALVLGVSLLASYATAVMVNAVRIAISMWLAAHTAVLPTVSASDVHRFEGIMVYFGGLVLLYELAQRLDRRACEMECQLGADALGAKAAP